MNVGGWAGERARAGALSKQAMAWEQNAKKSIAATMCRPLSRCATGFQTDTTHNVRGLQLVLEKLELLLELVAPLHDGRVEALEGGHLAVHLRRGQEG